MKIKDLIKLFRKHWITDEAFNNKEFISYFLKDATIENLKEMKCDNKTIDYFESIPLWDIKGIGPSKAIELWKAGVRPNNLSKFKKILPEITLLTMKYKPISKIPRELIEEIYNDFIPKGEKTKSILVGSYRRQTSTSNDIDILYFGDLKKFLEKLELIHEKNWIVFAKGSSKIAGFFIHKKATVEIDLWVADENNKYYMLLYATGSREHNIKMRFIAKHKKMKLNQYGLFDENNKLIVVKSEKEIFEKLNMEYKLPYMR